jgi:hypothetical protein
MQNGPRGPFDLGNGGGLVQGTEFARRLATEIAKRRANSVTIEKIQEMEKSKAFAVYYITSKNFSVQEASMDSR